MFGRGGKAEGGIALCGIWELSVRAILLPFQTDRTYVAESVAKSVFATLNINITRKINTFHSNTRNGIHWKDRPAKYVRQTLSGNTQKGNQYVSTARLISEKKKTTA